MKKLLLFACAIVVAIATFAQSKMVEIPKQDAIKYVANTGVTVPVLPSSSCYSPCVNTCCFCVSA